LGIIDNGKGFMVSTSFNGNGDRKRSKNFSLLRFHHETLAKSIISYRKTFKR
jgi:hypothetical protein